MRLKTDKIHVKKLTLILFLTASGSWASSKCPLHFEKMSVYHELWNYSASIKVNRSAKFNELTFSFDGELTYYELIKFLKKDADALKDLDSVFVQEFSKKELLKILKISEKQFDTFVIKKGSELAQKKSFKLHHLPPKYFAYAMDHFMFNNYYDFMKIYQPLEDVAVKYLKKNKFPIEAHQDSGFIELTHKNFENIPSKFHDLMFKMDDHFRESTMHLHLGVPEQSIEKHEMIFVANAVEARVTLKMVENGIERELPYNKTTIGKAVFEEYPGSERGLVKLTLNDFGNGEVHNLELRQYSTMEEGLDYLAFSSYLAKNAKQMKSVKLKDYYFLHTNYGNVQGSLDFLSELYAQLPEVHYQKWAKELKRLADDINSENEKSVIKKVQKFLKDTSLLEDLKTNQNLYLDRSNKS